MNDLLDKFKDYRPLPTYPAYPPYHTGFYLEDYFYNYYYQNSIKTDRILIPVSWTTLYIERKTKGLQELLNTLNPNGSYFAVSQHDDAILEKLPIDTVHFCAGGNSRGIPIPLVCSPIPQEDILNQSRDLLCSFYGSITYYLRPRMVYTMKDKPFTEIDCHGWSCSVSNNHYRKYIETATRSRFLLCPRGNAPNSFRLYESFQLGCVPVIITDVNFLPWEDELEWSSFAVITSDIPGLYDKLLNISDDEYRSMLSIGQKLYKTYFTLDGVCNNIVKRLSI